MLFGFGSAAFLQAGVEAFEHYQRHHHGVGHVYGLGLALFLWAARYRSLQDDL